MPLASACGPELAPASEVTGLRVLAVQKNRPYARPGGQVDLTMLWHDGNRERDGQTPEIAWLAACDNPAGDLYALCFEQFAALGQGALQGDGAALAGRVSLPTGDGPNDRFSVTIARDIISSRPRDPNVTPVPYGLSYVFFAACAGTLGLDPDLAIPFVCFEDRDGDGLFGEGDERLGAEAFVMGYTAVFVYDELENENPVVWGVHFDGEDYVPQGSSGGVALREEDLCVGDACEAVDADASASDCPDGLTVASCEGDCDEHAFDALVDPDSAEVDEVTSASGRERLLEQMWINYYASGGSFEEGDIKLLNDATAGWNADHDVKYAPGDEAGAHYLWAVAHDHRGGTSWARLRICTE